jgi:Uma2 family endonuclease
MTMTTTATTAEQFAELMPDATQLLSDEPEMESTLHWAQLVLLATCLEWHWRDRSNYFIGTNLTIYFSRQQLKTRDFRGPDFFLVKGTDNKPRKSWVVWEEGGKYPDLIIELLSDSTAEIDRDIKKEIYQDRFRTPEYFWFSPETLEFKGLRLQDDEYVEIPATERGWRWSKVLNLYLGLEGNQLRYFTAEGDIVLTMQEETHQAIYVAEEAIAKAEEAKAEAEEAKAEAEEAKAEAEEAKAEAEEAKAEAESALQRAEEETKRAELLAAKLRELGIDPNSIN